MSRRFVAKTAAQLAAWQTASLEGLDLVGLLIDGVHIGEHCLIAGPRDRRRWPESLISRTRLVKRNVKLGGAGR